ncbi:MAG: glutamate formimidoyltransferase [Oscillospiraceae bacterium]|nr:glutamate formimidoyltransferase [Oscillospiraceae bacterium]
MKIVQCVPNFSEGKDKEKIERIVCTLKYKEGFKLVNYEPDPNYNRTVVTLIGDLYAIKNALIPFVEVIESEIDMNLHKGEHLRMGALDVLPFVPINDVTMDECIEVSKEIGREIGEKFNIPVYLYEESATSPDRINLANIRKGEFEGLSKKMEDPLWKPDYGPNEPHNTFGAIAIGARNPLIAFNIDLDTENVEIANTISRYIRNLNGGYRFVKAAGVKLYDRNICQVTMNITDYKKTAMYRVFQTVKFEALRYGIDVKACELIGLVPLDTLLLSLEYYCNCSGINIKAFELKENYSFKVIIEQLEKCMGLYGFNETKIIEYYI